MPVPTQTTSGEGIDPTAFRVLVTGYGPFHTIEHNPSWLAVKPFQNSLLHTLGPDPRPIHITVLQVPVSYTSVLSLTPGFHARPPVLPKSTMLGENADLPLPPAEGFDFVLHVGVAGPGPMRAEMRGRKVGYNVRDGYGELCQVVNEEDEKMPARGFGKGYEELPAEMFTEVDCEKMIAYLKETGFDQLVQSTDAGLYLCEFINYCSLAESRRSATQSGGEKTTPTLFLHIPPVDEPLGTEEVTEVLKKVVLWVCSQQE